MCAVSPSLVNLAECTPITTSASPCLRSRRLRSGRTCMQLMQQYVQKSRTITLPRSSRSDSGRPVFSQPSPPSSSGARTRGWGSSVAMEASTIIDSMKIGLVGLPKSGKTTLFNLLTGSSVATSKYDGGRAELHTGVARVPDPRVDRLTVLFKPKKTTYATFQVVDLAGIEKGGRSALDAKEFRNADALLHVVRAFADDARGAADPKRDILDLEMELILADLEVVDRRLERLEASIKKQRKDAEVKEHEVLGRLKIALESETPLRAASLTPDDARVIRGFSFLSEKPVLYLVNVQEKVM